MNTLKTKTGKPMTPKQLWARRRNWELRSLRYITQELDLDFIADALKLNYMVQFQDLQRFPKQS